jgi:hypothetical protein
MRRQKEKKALSPTVYDALSRRARDIAENLFRSQEFVFTAEEFVLATIDPEHVAPLRKVEDICGSIGRGDIVKLKYPIEGYPKEPFTFMVRFPDKSPIIVPDYVEETEGFRPSCPPELRARFDDWARERIRVGNMAGDFFDCLMVFNDWLPDPRSMAVMLPVLPTLVMRSSSMGDKQKEDTLRQMGKGDFKIPTLPPQVTKRMNDASGLIAAMALLPSQKRAEASITVDRSYVYEYMTVNPFLFHEVKGCPHSSRARGTTM